MFTKKRFSVITSFILSIFLVAGISNLQVQDDTVVDVINNSEDPTKTDQAVCLSCQQAIREGVRAQ